MQRLDLGEQVRQGGVPGKAVKQDAPGGFGGFGSGPSRGWHAQTVAGPWRTVRVIGVPWRDTRCVADSSDCVSCASEARPKGPPRERVYLGPRWRVAHAFGTGLPGWLVVLPRRHVVALDELTPEEAADLGPLLREITSALRQVTGCQKTYVALFAEAEGFSHVHFHVVPRMAGLAPELRGSRVFGLMGGDPARNVPDGDMDQIAARITAALPAKIPQADPSGQ